MIAKRYSSAALGGVGLVYRTNIPQEKIVPGNLHPTNGCHLLLSRDLVTHGQNRMVLAEKINATLNRFA